MPISWRGTASSAAASGASPAGGAGESKPSRCLRDNLGHLTREPDQPWLVDPRSCSVPVGRTKEATMDGLAGVIQRPEKPGRLQLAIIEWQRQLIAKQEAREAA
jgi:hypothetical protein